MVEASRRMFEISQKIDASEGVKFLNRQHGRSFSLNIFRNNAKELIDSVRNISDPDRGLYLISEPNKDVGTQAHREVNRHIHNFVASAKTLVDHTRVFIEEHYQSNELYREYKYYTAKLSSDPTIKFVHDLRNYMVHKGLPNSTMFLHLEQDPSRPDLGAQIETGVRLNGKELLNWHGWTAPSQSYLEETGENVDIEAFVTTYVSKVEDFQNWLLGRLNQIHADELSELATLQNEYAALELQSTTPNGTSDVQSEILSIPNDFGSDQFVFGSSVAEEIDRIGAAIFGRLRKLTLSSRPNNEFKGERPTHASITAEKLIGEPVVWCDDAAGNRVIAFIFNNSETFGLDDESYDLAQLLEAVTKEGWALECLSPKFVENVFIQWCRSSYASSSVHLSQLICLESQKHVKSLEVWVPIANVEVEEEFNFASSRIAPISAAMINRLEADGIEYSPSQEIEIRQFFTKLRESMQGFAAVVLEIRAVADKAGELGLAQAQEVVSLLRFLSPAASSPEILCAVALLGNEHVPKSHVLLLGEGTFHYTASVIPNVKTWRLSANEVLELRETFDLVGVLGRVGDLSEFEKVVKSSLILFGTGSTSMYPADRLIYSLSAVENVLLESEFEVASYSIAERMAQLLAADEDGRVSLGRDVRAIYVLRSRLGSVNWSAFDEDTLDRFVKATYTVLSIALNNAGRFGTRTAFLNAVSSYTG